MATTTCKEIKTILRNTNLQLPLMQQRSCSHEILLRLNRAFLVLLSKKKQYLVFCNRDKMTLTGQ